MNDVPENSESQIEKSSLGSGEAPQTSMERRDALREMREKLEQLKQEREENKDTDKRNSVPNVTEKRMEEALGRLWDSGQEPSSEKKGLSKEQEAQFSERIDEVGVREGRDAADVIRLERYKARCDAEGRTPDSDRKWYEKLEQLRENREKGKEDENQVLELLGVDNNNYAKTSDGQEREVKVYKSEDGVTTRPDGVTDKCWIEVKSINEGVVYNTGQLEAQKEGAQYDGEKNLVVIITSNDRDTVRPSGPLSEEVDVYHYSKEIKEWSY